MTVHRGCLIRHRGKSYRLISLRMALKNQPPAVDLSANSDWLLFDGTPLDHIYTRDRGLFGKFEVFCVKL